MVVLLKPPPPPRRSSRSHGQIKVWETMDAPNITLWSKCDWFQRYGRGQTKMAHSLTTIGVHLECAIQTELERKQSRRFRHNTIIMAERYERVPVGWHCAKVTGHAGLKIETPKVKTSSYHVTKLYHSNRNSFSPFTPIFKKRLKS